MEVAEAFGYVRSLNCSAGVNRIIGTGGEEVSADSPSSLAGDQLLP